MRITRLLLLAFLLSVSGVFIACGGDDETDQDEHMDAEHMDHMAEPGVVSTRPANSSQVNVTLREWAIAPDQSSVKAGKVYFLVKNEGPVHPHEMVIVRTDLGPLSLPFEDSKVPEDQIDVVNEIAEFAPNSSASLTVELTPGKYLLICNISEEDEEIGNHYKRGMVATFTVEE